VEVIVVCVLRSALEEFTKRKAVGRMELIKCEGILFSISVCAKGGHVPVTTLLRVDVQTVYSVFFKNGNRLESCSYLGNGVLFSGYKLHDTILYNFKCQAEKIFCSFITR
jgi:hypothetical protein